MNRLSYLWVALVLLCLAGRGAEADPPLAVAPFGSEQARAHQKAWADHLGTPVHITNRLGMKFNLIPPGEFVMGSPESEPERRDRETQHKVRITKPFYLGTHEITQEQYQRTRRLQPRKIDKDPSAFVSRGTLPVERLSWDNAVAFCGRLSDEEGVEYRLPTEAEWEYACRVGTSAAYSFGDDERQLPQYAWYKDNSKGSTHPVGSLKPNAWGLFDMHGNVYEWCQDRYGDYESLQVMSDPIGAPSGNRRVLRGGAFGYQPGDVRTAYRYAHLPQARNPNFGFRLARTIPLSP
jgi:formylglycine-generating enzyme required for sulfatase activity